MGPGSIDPGKLLFHVPVDHISGLQWGRDRSIPESELQNGTEVGVEQLQWGRDRSIAERMAVTS